MERIVEEEEEEEVLVVQQVQQVLCHVKCDCLLSNMTLAIITHFSPACVNHQLVRATCQPSQ